MRKYAKVSGVNLKLEIFDSGKGNIKSVGRGHIGDFESIEDLKEVLQELIDNYQFPVKN